MEKPSEGVKTSSEDKECRAPLSLGVLGGRPSKTFDLKLEGALVGMDWEDG